MLEKAPVRDTMVKTIWGNSKIPIRAIGRIIERKRKGTLLPSIFANQLGDIWVKFGREKDNNVRIVSIPRDSLEYAPIPPKKQRVPTTLAGLMELLEVEFEDC